MATIPSHEGGETHTADSEIVQQTPITLTALKVLFEDGTFKLIVEFTEEYPNKPPTVRFVSKMFHPNVYAGGSICLDILQNRWSPTYNVSSILTSIQFVSSTRPFLRRTSSP